MTSKRHLWIAHLSISATKTKPKFKLSTQLQLLKNGHFIENHLIYWSPTLWWQTSRYSCNPAAYVLVSWQLSDSSVMFTNMPALSPAPITHQTRPPHTWIESHFWHQCRRRSGGGRTTCTGVIAANRTTTTGRSTGTYQLSDPLASRGKHSRSGSDIGDHWWLDPMAEIVVHPQRRARLCQALRSSLVCSTTCCCSQSLQIIAPNTRLLAF